MRWSKIAVSLKESRNRSPDLALSFFFVAAVEKKK